MRTGIYSSWQLATPLSKRVAFHLTGHTIMVWKGPRSPKHILTMAVCDPIFRPLSLLVGQDRCGDRILRSCLQKGPTTTPANYVEVMATCLAFQSYCHLAQFDAGPCDKPSFGLAAFSVFPCHFRQFCVFQRQRDDNKHKIYAFEENRPKTLVFKGNAMTIKFWKCKFYCREILLSLRRVLVLEHPEDTICHSLSHKTSHTTI